MTSMSKYSRLIKLIPVYNQSTTIKKEAWEKFSYDKAIKKAIFGNNDNVELSRADVFSEVDTAKKIVMVLMWGYPTGGRGNNIESILKRIDSLCELLSSVYKKDLTKAQVDCLISKFKGIHGLGISTWSKLLYFFNVSVDSKKCQIYDLKIVDSLNKKQFNEIGTHRWRQNIDHYHQYIGLMDKLAKSMKVCPEQVELFLFYYNLYYKF